MAGWKSSLDPCAHGILMSAEQTGDVLYRVVAVDFDKAMVGVTFFHDGYRPPVPSVATGSRLVAVSSLNTSLTLAISSSQEPGTFVWVEEVSSANPGRTQALLLNPCADRVRAHSPEVCQFVYVHQPRHSRNALH